MKINFKKLFWEELKNNPFCILDVGARGGIKAEWKQLLPHIQVIGFEPDGTESARLMQDSSGGRFHCYTTAISATHGSSPFYITKIAGLSSLREPNREFLSRFSEQNIAGYEIEKIDTLQTKPLDDVLSPDDMRGIDFVKVDVEGCAWEVLTGAARLIEQSDILGFRIELEFNQKYKEQHLYPEVCLLLIRYGYELVQIKPCFWKYKAGLKTGGSNGMLVHGDFFFFLGFPELLKRISKLSQVDASLKLYKYLVLSCIYGQYDRAYETLRVAREKEIWSEDQSQTILRYLAPSRSLLARLPKLQEKGGFWEYLYYWEMALFGFFLRRMHVWNPSVEL